MAGLSARIFDDGDKAPLDPFSLFEEWFEAAKGSESNDPNAMTLATVDSDGMPDARAVLLNGRSPDGLVFFSNARSAKGAQLAANPRAALLFHWKSLFRQVRVRGPVEEVAPDLTTTYFHSRPRGSQLAAQASEQSQPLASRDELTARVARLESRYEGREVPRPDDWKGYRIRPASWEFWQAGEFRLHDRVRFTKMGDGWVRQRLNP